MRSTTAIVYVFFIFFMVFSVYCDCVIVKPKTTLAIIDCESNSFSRFDADRISNSLRQHLSKNSQVRIISKGRTTRILKDNGFAKPEDLYKNNDIINIGKKLGANRVLKALAIKIDDLIILSIKVTDVKTHYTTKATSSFSGSFEKFLNMSVEEVAEKIIKRL